MCLEEGHQVAAFYISSILAISEHYENVSCGISQPSFERVGAGSRHKIAHCSGVTINLSSMVPARGRPTWRAPHLGCLLQEGPGGAGHIRPGTGLARAATCRAPVAQGAGGCKLVPYNGYISALWCLCNLGLSVRSVEARPEQELLGIWGLVLLA